MFFLTLQFSSFQKSILDERELGNHHPMFDVIFMEEACHANVVMMPIPAKSASAETKQRFADRYFEEVFEKYQVKK